MVGRHEWELGVGTGEETGPGEWPESSKAQREADQED